MSTENNSAHHNSSYDEAVIKDDDYLAEMSERLRRLRSLTSDKDATPPTQFHAGGKTTVRYS